MILLGSQKNYANAWQNVKVLLSFCIYLESFFQIVEIYLISFTIQVKKSLCFQVKYLLTIPRKPYVFQVMDYSNWQRKSVAVTDADETFH
jgi:hypothetical protein